MLPGDEQTYTLRWITEARRNRALSQAFHRRGQLTEILELQVTQDVHRLYEGTMQDAQSGIAMGRYASQEMTTIRITASSERNRQCIFDQGSCCRCRAHCTDDTESVATGDQTQRTLLISSIAGIHLLPDHHRKKEAKRS